MRPELEKIYAKADKTPGSVIVTVEVIFVRTLVIIILKCRKKDHFLKKTERY